MGRIVTGGVLVALVVLAGCTPTPEPLPPPANTPPPVSVNNTPPVSENITPPPASNVTPPSANGTPPAAVKGPYDVWIETHEFKPSIMTVPAGTTITWTNKDSEFHTVTSGTGLFSAGLSFTQVFRFTFTRAGTYDYHCDPHPDMTGTIHVQ